MLDCLKIHERGIILSLYVQPRSSRNMIVGLQEENLKIKLTSPPVDGSANQCCREFLAKLFRVPKSDISLLSGEKSRQKRILLQGLIPSEVESILRPLLADS